MDTGFRRHDKTFVPSCRPNPTCTYILQGGPERLEKKFFLCVLCGDHNPDYCFANFAFFAAIVLLVFLR